MGFQTQMSVDSARSTKFKEGPDLGCLEINLKVRMFRF